jgi:hypothetical protein
VDHSLAQWIHSVQHTFALGCSLICREVTGHLLLIYVYGILLHLIKRKSPFLLFTIALLFYDH